MLAYEHEMQLAILQVMHAGGYPARRENPVEQLEHVLLAEHESQLATLHVTQLPSTAVNPVLH